MNVISSIVKSFKINKISRELSKPIDSYNDLMSDNSTKNRDKLFKLISTYDSLTPILMKYSADNDTLDNILDRLLNVGAGQWVKTDFVAVSALVFPKTLDYVLKQYNDPETDWSEVTFNLIMYFQHGDESGIAII
jgi:hypothetical protein